MLRPIWGPLQAIRSLRDEQLATLAAWIAAEPSVEPLQRKIDALHQFITLRVLTGAMDEDDDDGEPYYMNYDRDLRDVVRHFPAQFPPFPPF